MNKVILTGNLTRDPELTETANGVKVCRFSIAVNRKTGGETIADFYNCTAWRGLGEVVANYTHKGDKVAVSGNIELRNYEDSQGVKRTAIDIIAQDVEFLTVKQTVSEKPCREPDGYVAPPKQRSMYDKPPRLEPFDDDDDIPF